MVGDVDARTHSFEQFHGDLLVDLVVLGEENAHARKPHAHAGRLGRATGGLGGTSAAGEIGQRIPYVAHVNGALNPAVGIPIVTAEEGPVLVNGRPTIIRELPWNVSSYNTLNAGVGGVSVPAGVDQGVGFRPSYNLVVGSTRSLGGDSPAATGILGVKLKLDTDVDAGAEFAAYYSSGDAVVGSISNINGVWLDWTNSNGFYAAQINPLGPSDWGNAQKIAGIGSTSDIRPIIPTSATSQGNRRLVPFQDQAQFLTSHDNLGTFNTQNFYMSRNPFSWGSTSVTSQVQLTF